MKDKCIKIFNAQLKGESVDINEIVTLLSEFFEDIGHPEEVSKFSSNPEYIKLIFSDMIQHMTKKYHICSIIKNNKILMYYDAN